MTVNSDYYLSRAAESAREAEQASLENVRQRCLRAEAAWRAMAMRLLYAEGVREEVARKRLEERA